MIAFVISTPEIAVVNALHGEGKPYMAGSLFYFTRSQVAPYLNELAAYTAKAEDHEDRNAALRLAERLGSWIGKEVVEAKAEAPSPAPAPAAKKGRKPAMRHIGAFHSGGPVKLEPNEVPVLLTSETVVPYSTLEALTADD